MEGYRTDPMQSPCQRRKSFSWAGAGVEREKDRRDSPSLTLLHPREIEKVAESRGALYPNLCA